MNQDSIQEKIQNTVLARIERGEVPMRSRAYFGVRLALAVALSLLVLALSVFVLSFIVFSIHESGEQFLLGFGAQGLSTFLALFPWLPLCLDIGLIVVLEWLLQGFSFGYRISLATLFFAVCACSAVLAFLVNLTPLHPMLLDRADHGELPFMGDIYENSVRGSHEPQGIFRGTVTQVQGDRITIEHDDGDHDADDGTRTIMLPPGAPAFKPGDRAYIFGTSTGEAVQAYGAEHLAPEQ